MTIQLLVSGFFAVTGAVALGVAVTHDAATTRAATSGVCMVSSRDNEAARPNPLLQTLSILVGTWTTVGTHPLVPGKTFHGRTTFSWIEGGAFLAMRSQIDEPEIPNGIAIFGTDDATGECSMLYFDATRLTSRAMSGDSGAMPTSCPNGS